MKVTIYSVCSHSYSTLVQRHKSPTSCVFLSPTTGENVCLQCWYDACVPDGLQFSDSFRDRCCTCILNEPLDETDMQQLQEARCRTEIFSDKYINESDPGQCCRAARTDFLFFYMEPDNSGNSTCLEQSNVFNQSLSINESVAANVTSVPTASMEYIIPSMTFPCSGCLSRLDLLTVGGYIVGGGNEVLMVHLWSRREVSAGSVNGDELYERRTNFTISVEPEVNVTGNGSQVLSFIIAEEDEVCFQPGDVFGLSLPPTSNIPEIMVVGPRDEEPQSYIVEEPLPYCEQLHSLYEPVLEDAIDGELQIQLLVTGELLHIPSSMVSE